MRKNVTRALPFLVAGTYLSVLAGCSAGPADDSALRAELKTLSEKVKVLEASLDSQNRESVTTPLVVQGGATNKIVARSITIIDQKNQVRAFLGLNDEDDLNGGVGLRLFDANGHEGVTLFQDDEAGARLYMSDSRGRLYLQIVGVESGDDNAGFVRVGGRWEGSVLTAVLRPGMLTFEKDGKETYSLRPAKNGK